jgi:hypothetical protein
VRSQGKRSHRRSNTAAPRCATGRRPHPSTTPVAGRLRR